MKYVLEREKGNGIFLAVRLDFRDNRFGVIWILVLIIDYIILIISRWQTYKHISNLPNKRGEMLFVAELIRKIFTRRHKFLLHLTIEIDISFIFKVSNSHNLNI